jgi:hypothetical protein
MSRGNVGSTPVLQSVSGPALECAPDGKKLRSEREALELIGEAMQHGASLVLVPVKRLEDDFFRLGTRIAGGIVSRHVSASLALRDFVREANRGDRVWFVANVAEIEQRLQRPADGRGTSETAD